MNIGVIGFGFVGKATSMFSNLENLIVYDTDPELCRPRGLTFQKLEMAQVIFICVPTPMRKDGGVHIDIVRNVVNDVKKIVEKNCPIVVRSTVPPGTCDELGTFFMPEFLTEKNFLNDFKDANEWIIGYPENHNETQKIRLNYIIEQAHNAKYINSKQTIFMPNKEAEMVKYFKNNFLATKVAFCNEIYQFCKVRDIDYNKVIDTVCLDSRITKSHTSVPGHDGKLGFGGTCFPKDCEGLLAEFNLHNIPSYVIRSSLERNKIIDRPEQDWKLDKGRAVLE
jgi:nucleotide sugar dehydrogenase